MPGAKVVHRAKWMNAQGHCRPLCRPKGPRVNYSKEQSALEDERVTCAKCLALMSAGDGAWTGGPGR